MMDKTKYLVLLLDGVADEKYGNLDDKTPLEYANTPNMDSIVKFSEIGMVQTIPNGLVAGSDVANMALLGLNPLDYKIGRSWLEAVGGDIPVLDSQICLRVNFVKFSKDRAFENKKIENYGVYLGREEQEKIIELLNRNITMAAEFYCGIGYRAIYVETEKEKYPNFFQPHKIVNMPIKDYLPKDDYFKNLIISANKVLEKSEFKERVDGIWFWSLGKKMEFPQFESKYNLKGRVVSGVDLIRGIGKTAGLDIVKIDGTTGNIDTNYKGKVRATIEAFEVGKDFVYLHFEAPDDASHKKDVNEKICAIEYADSKLLKPILQYLENSGHRFKIMILSDHRTLLRTGDHDSKPVPYMIYDSERVYKKEKANKFCEEIAEKGRTFQKGNELLEYFIDMNYNKK